MHATLAILIQAHGRGPGLVAKRNFKVALCDSLEYIRFHLSGVERPCATDFADGKKRSETQIA